MIHISLIDILGWGGNIFFIVGAYLLAKKRPIPCCVANIIGNGIYIIVGIVTKLTSLWAISIFLLLLAIYGIYNWRQTGGKRNE